MSGAIELQVLFCGVGGQGVLGAADVLGRALFAAGKTVNVGQLHGMSQRGGSVSSFILVGKAEAALLDGAPDVVVALEPLEAARAAAGFGQNTTVLLNTRPVVPYERTRLGKEYPDLDELLARVGALAGRVLIADVTGALAPLGLERAIGVAMLGAMSRLPALEALGLPKDTLLSALGDSAASQRAFALGENLSFSTLSKTVNQAGTQSLTHSPNQAPGTRDGLQARH